MGIHDLNLRMMPYSEVPACCRMCCRLELEPNDEPSKVIASCSRDLRLPTKKGSCKAQLIYKG